MSYPSEHTDAEYDALKLELARTLDYLREKNEIIKAYHDAAGGRNPEELAFVLEGPTHHVIDLRRDGWTIKHPLSCRPDLFNCQVHRRAERQLNGHPRGRAYGQYRVDLIGDDKPVLRIAQKPEREKAG